MARRARDHDSIPHNGRLISFLSVSIQGAPNEVGLVERDMSEARDDVGKADPLPFLIGIGNARSDFTFQTVSSAACARAMSIGSFSDENGMVG